MLSSRVWFVCVAGGEPVGPVSTELLARGLAAGKVPRDAMVAAPGSPSWTPALSVGEIAATLWRLEAAPVPAYRIVDVGLASAEEEVHDWAKTVRVQRRPAPLTPAAPTGSSAPPLPPPVVRLAPEVRPVAAPSAPPLPPPVTARVAPPLAPAPPWAAPPPPLPARSGRGWQGSHAAP